MTMRDDIANTIAALPFRVDTRDWHGLTALFTPHIVIDYTSLLGGEVRRTTRETQVASWRNLLLGFTATEHLIGTPLIAVTGEHAEAKASMIAWHFIADMGPAQDSWRVGGRYEIGLSRGNDDIWRISRLTLANGWQQGNLDLPKIAMDRVAAAKG